jgi:hypothetical protein
LNYQALISEYQPVFMGRIMDSAKPPLELAFKEITKKSTG